MSSDDFPGEMEEFPFDDRDADALFGASPGSASVPADLRDVADLVHAARGAGSAGELLGADVVVARIAAAVGEPAPSIPVDAHERTRVLKKFRTVKLAATATATLMLGATAAAAATGSLPSPVQSSVATGLSNVGISLPAHHHVVLAAKHASPAAHVQPHHDGEKHVGKGHEHEHGVIGTVASVNGTSTTGACPNTATGSFTLTGRKGATFTVNVTTATSFFDKGVTTPSFANVCVGLRACAKGTIAGTTLTATKVLILPAVPPAPPVPPNPPRGAFGKVASVGGMSTGCGAGTDGQFTIDAAESKTFTVNVSLATTYLEKGVPSPTFANVCVGELVFAKGTVADTTVTATGVLIAPVRHKKEHHHGVFGTVVSVNGLTDAGTCGKAGGMGTFALTGHMKTSTTAIVSVGTATKFRAFGVPDASFANVCVGARVGVLGDASDTTFAAIAVFVVPAHAGDDHSGDDHSADDLFDHSGRGHKSGDDHFGDHHRVGGHKSGRGHKGNAGSGAVPPSGGSGSEH